MGLDLCFLAEDGIRDFCLSRGLGDVYERQLVCGVVVTLLVQCNVSRPPALICGVVVTLLVQCNVSRPPALVCGVVVTLLVQCNVSRPPAPVCGLVVTLSLIHL